MSARPATATWTRIKDLRIYLKMRLPTPSNASLWIYSNPKLVLRSQTNTGYTLCWKIGDKETGKADIILHILLNTLGAGLYYVKRFKTDQGKNLTGGIIQEITKKLGIWQDTSSAYNPAENRLAKNTVKRVKKAMGNRKIEDAMQDIIALNLSPPYNNQRLTPFEAMHGLVSPVNRIPMTESGEKEPVNRD